MRHLKHCMNPKVIVVLAVAAVGVWVFAPGAFAAALPLLVVAICPLSMIGMMYMMGRGGKGPTEQASEKGAEEGPDGRAMEALAAQVSDLEARLGAQSVPVETEPREATSQPRPAQG